MALNKRQLAEIMDRRAQQAVGAEGRNSHADDALLVRANISDRKSGANPIKVSCQCDPPRSIRVFPTVLGDGPIICGMCDRDFE